MTSAILYGNIQLLLRMLQIIMPITDFINPDRKYIRFECDKLLTFKECLRLEQTVPTKKLYHDTNCIGVGIYRYSIVLNDYDNNKSVCFSTESVEYQEYISLPIISSPIVVINNYNFDEYLDLTLIEIFERFKLLELYS